MRKVPLAATVAIAAVTGVVSGFFLLSPWNDLAIVGAGFIPARVSGLAGLGEGMVGVPALLTPLTAILLHEQILGLIFDLFVLVFLGRQVEQALGVKGLVTLYAAATALSALARWAVAPDSLEPMVGAFGPVAAMLAAYSMLYGDARTSAVGPFSARTIQALWLGVVWAAICLAMGIGAPSGMLVSASAPIAGFIVGLVLTRPLLLWRWRKA
ncbi:MAG: rhomboid family intramembrane serine protease [Pseudomonadota bacterium]